jgi:rhodanese-related sulfurtransferase
MPAWLQRLLRRPSAEAAQPAGPTWIDVEALRRRLARGETPIIVDVRGSDEFSGPLGHIDGALNIPLAGLPAQIAGLGRAQASIVLVCLTDKRSSQAAAALAAAGIADVAVLRGGMRAWRGA